MEDLLNFINDMGAVWERYGSSMLLGTWNTFLLAVICTVMGLSSVLA